MYFYYHFYYYKEYNTESIEKIQRVLEILDIQTSGKESERFQKFIENDIRFEEIFRYVARNIIEKNEYSEFKELLKFAKSAKIHLDDETLEFKVKKDKKGVELERLIQEVAKLKFLKKVISSKLL